MYDAAVAVLRENLEKAGRGGLSMEELLRVNEAHVAATLRTVALLIEAEEAFIWPRADGALMISPV